jgi:hypothetical protein
VLAQPALEAAITHKGYRIAHYGQIDTDLQFSEFFAGAHTITAWVMPEFAYNDYGPIFGVKGSGSFAVGQGDYRTGNGGYKKAGYPVLSVKVGTMEARYLAPGYQRRRWNHIAVTRARLFDGWVFLLYLNGQPLTPMKAHVTMLSNYSPSGTLRVGRTNSNMYGPQFYGHIDDVAVFNKAMSAAEIAGVMKNGIPITNLVAGYAFNVVTGVLESSKFKRPIVANSRAFHVNMSYPRNNAVDGALFDNPLLVSPSSVANRLPFTKGQVWRVIQEFDSRGGSHNGYAAFAWDFGRVDAATTKDPVIASSSGQVVSANDGANGAIRVQVVANLEYSQYMHTAAGSFEQLVFDPSGRLWWPNPNQSITWIPIQVNQPLVKLDPTQNHLHFSNINEGPLNPVGRSIPGAFIDYEVSTDQGVTWKWVWRGMPRDGQWVRRAN